MRLTDGVIALPLLPLLIVLAAIDLNKLGLPASVVQSEAVSLYRIVLIIALVGWTTVARLVRAETLAMRGREFVRAAVAQGATAGRIMRVHILPNIVRSEEHTSELQSLMRISYAVFCLKKKTRQTHPS